MYRRAVCVRYTYGVWTFVLCLCSRFLVTLEHTLYENRILIVHIYSIHYHVQYSMRLCFHKSLNFIFQMVRCTMTRPIKFIIIYIKYISTIHYCLSSLKMCFDEQCIYRSIFVFATIIVQVQKLYKINNTKMRCPNILVNNAHIIHMYTQGLPICNVKVFQHFVDVCILAFFAFYVVSQPVLRGSSYS